jgi:DNA invertase Pin-like site-specific DNA recombinase
VEHTMTKITRAALYLRVSTEDQNTENQLPALHALATRKGYQIVAEFIDKGISGGTSDRAQFQNMFRAAERHEFDVLIFWSLDRLTREGTLATLKHLDRLAKAGVGYASAKEEYLDTANPFNDISLAIASTMAKQERARMAERIKAGMARAKVVGTKRGGPIGRVFVPLNDKNKAMKMKAEGCSLRSIARAMNQPLSTVRNRLQEATA